MYVVFAAAIMLLAGIIVDGTLLIVMILAVHNGEYVIVKTMNFAGQNNELVFLFGLALLTLATGLSTGAADRFRRAPAPPCRPFGSLACEDFARPEVAGGLR